MQGYSVPATLTMPVSPAPVRCGVRRHRDEQFGRQRQPFAADAEHQARGVEDLRVGGGLAEVRGPVFFVVLTDETLQVALGGAGVHFAIAAVDVLFEFFAALVADHADAVPAVFDAGRGQGWGGGGDRHVWTPL
jgi:hypothetical protein